MNRETIDKLKQRDACEEAIDWLETQPDFGTAWATCTRGDWMLWLLERLKGRPQGEGHKRLSLCVCEAVRPCLEFVPSGEDRPRFAMETTERWAKGLASWEDVRSARSASRSATMSAAESATMSAAESATRLASESATRLAAESAAGLAAESAALAAESAALAAQADIVRKHYPEPPELP